MPDRWFYVRDKQRHGPVTAAKLKQMAKDGWLVADDLVWCEELPDWVPASKVRGLFGTPLSKRLPEMITGVQPKPPINAPQAQAFEPQGSGSVVVINQPPVQRWSPGLAAVLSFLIPGLGQIYKGQIINGLAWFLFVLLGYAALIVPGLLLHLFCIVGAARGNPWTQGTTTVVRR